MTHSLWRRVAHHRRASVVALLLAAHVACAGDPNERKQRFLRSGDAYFAQNRYAEAVIEYRNAVQIDPRFAEARVKLAEAHARLGDAAGALQEYVRAADLRPDDAELQLTAGTYLLAARRPSEALARADAALRSKPDSVSAHVLRGNALGGLNDLESALKEIEQAIKLDPSQGATFIQLGLVEMARGRESEAEVALLNAVHLAPTSVETHLALAHFYWVRNRREDAESSFGKALKLQPRHALANRAMAAFCLSADRIAEAERYLKVLAENSKVPGAVFALTDYYVRSGRPRDAIVRLEPLVTVGREWPGARIRLAQAYAEAADLTRAHALVDDLLRQDPRHSEAQLLKGELLLRAGQRDEALGHVRAAADAAPQSSLAQFALGKMFAARGDVNAAEKAFREVIRLNPRAAAAQSELARLELASGRASASLRSAQEAVRQAPSSIPARLTLIRSLLATREFDRAEREIAALMSEYPGVAAVHVQRGVLAAERRDPGASRAAFEQAEKLDPESLEALAGLLALDLASGDMAAARTRVARRLERGGHRPELLLVAGRTHAAAGDFREAERTLREAIQAEPTLLPAYSLLGEVFLRQRKLAQALGEFDALATRQTRPVAALTMSGLILYAQGEKSEARKRFERVLTLDPSAPIAANNLAWMLAESGENLQAALDLAQKASARMPESPEIADTLGWVYLKKSQPDLAVVAFERAVEREARNPTYLYHLGLAHSGVGNAAAARRALERALGLGQAFTGEEDARRVLAGLNGSGR